MEDEKKTVTLTKEEFFMKSLSIIREDEHFKNDFMMGLFATTVVTLLTTKLFPEEESTNA